MLKLHPKASSSVRAPVDAETLVKVPQKVTLKEKLIEIFITLWPIANFTDRA